ncbi:MAG: serine hydrolase [Nitrososphaeraceae archaeon]
MKFDVTELIRRVHKIRTRKKSIIVIGVAVLVSLFSIYVILYTNALFRICSLHHMGRLIGIAIDEGLIASVDDPITKYIPELKQKDPRFNNITIKNLLTMSSGLSYVEQSLPWSDDTKTYYDTDLRSLALSAKIEEAPGKRFHYNNYNPLLLGIILERTTHKHVSQYLEEKIWKPLGMEAPGSWSLDSDASGFEKMESGINARAIDFAKIGRLFLNNGNWNGKQIISEKWVNESTRPDTTTDPAPFYQYMWWVDTTTATSSSSRDISHHNFYAAGNYGQFIYVIPEKNIIIVRHGYKSGYDNWISFFKELASKITICY